MVVTSAHAAELTSVEGLYRRYSRDVFALAYGVVGSRAEAEDVTQTTFLNAHRALLDGVEPADQRAWLLTIARNVCHSRFRTLGRRPREEPLDDSLFVPIAEEDESAPRAIDALRALLPRQRAALVMQAVEGCSTAEIGARLGLGASAVDALLFRARAALRDELQAEAEPAHCTRTEALVELQLRHELAGDERAGLRAHLRACSSCATTARRLRARKRIGSLLLLPWDLANRLAGLLGQGGAAVKVGAVVGALAIGTTVVVENGPPWRGGPETPVQQPAGAAATQPGTAAPVRRHDGTIAGRRASTRVGATLQTSSRPAHVQRSSPRPVARPGIGATAAASSRAPMPGTPSGTGDTTGAPARSPLLADDAAGVSHPLAVTDGVKGSAQAGAGTAGVSAGVELGTGGAAADVGVSTALLDAGAHVSADVSPSTGVSVTADVGASAPAVGGVDVSAAASGSAGVSASVTVTVPGGQPAVVTVGAPSLGTLPVQVSGLPGLAQLVPPLGG